jgi:hypothetical protein
VAFLNSETNLQQPVNKKIKNSQSFLGGVRGMGMGCKMKILHGITLYLLRRRTILQLNGQKKIRRNKLILNRL